MLLNKDYNDLKLQYDGKISDELTYELTINQLKTELTEAKEEKARVTKEISQKVTFKNLAQVCLVHLNFII